MTLYLVVVFFCIGAECKVASATTALFDKATCMFVKDETVAAVKRTQNYTVLEARCLEFKYGDRT